MDIVLDDSVNVNDVAELLKEFFREMKDSLLPDELYMSFLLTASEFSALHCWWQGVKTILKSGEHSERTHARESP